MISAPPLHYAGRRSCPTAPANLTGPTNPRQSSQPRSTCVKLAPRPRQPTSLAEVNLHFLCVRTVAFYNDLSWHLASFLCFVFIFISPSASARLPLRLAKSFHTLYVYTLTFLCRTQFRAPRPRVDKQLLRSRNDWLLSQNPQRRFLTQTAFRFEKVFYQPIF